MKCSTRLQGFLQCNCNYAVKLPLSGRNATHFLCPSFNATEKSTSFTRFANNLSRKMFSALRSSTKQKQQQQQKLLKKIVETTEDEFVCCYVTKLQKERTLQFHRSRSRPLKMPGLTMQKMQLLFDACLLISFGSKCTSNRWSRLEICIYCFCVGHFFVQLFHQWPFHSICMQSQLSYSDLDAPHVVRSDQFVCVYIQLHLFVFNIQVLASHISFGKPLLHLNSFPRYRQIKFISFEFLFC